MAKIFEIHKSHKQTFDIINDAEISVKHEYNANDFFLEQIDLTKGKKEGGYLKQLCFDRMLGIFNQVRELLKEEGIVERLEDRVIETAYT